MLSEHLVFQHCPEVLHAHVLQADVMLAPNHHYSYSAVLLHPALFCSGRAHSKYFLMHIEYKVLKGSFKNLFLDVFASCILK